MMKQKLEKVLYKNVNFMKFKQIAKPNERK